MVVILASKVGQFVTEAVDGLRPLEAYDYLFYGKKKAHFVIAELQREVKVKVIEAGAGGAVNHVPSKFLPRFGSIEQARAELKELTCFGGLDTALVRVELSPAPPSAPASDDLGIA